MVLVIVLLLLVILPVALIVLAVVLLVVPVVVLIIHNAHSPFLDLKVVCVAKRTSIHLKLRIIQLPI